MFFKFENFWLNYVGHHSVINEAWGLSLHGNPMQVFTHLLSRSRFKLNAWSRSGLCSIDSALARIGLDISALEYLDLFSKSHPLLLEHYSKLAALQRQCSTKWAQRAHLSWIMDGDKNSKKFQILFVTIPIINLFPRLLILKGGRSTSNLTLFKLFNIFIAGSGQLPQVRTPTFSTSCLYISQQSLIMIVIHSFVKSLRRKCIRWSSSYQQVSPLALMVLMLSCFGNFSLSLGIAWFVRLDIFL